MTQRIITTVGLIAAGLVLAILAGLVGVLYARPTEAQTTGVSGMRQVTVVGHGEVKGKPDTATVQIGVQTQKPTSQEALAQNSTDVQAVIQKLKDLSIDEKYIQTSNFNVAPTYDTDGRNITGYQVSNSVSVTIRNLDQTGALLDEVVKSGANSIYGVSFSVNDPKVLMNQARDAAIADAKERAAKLAGAANGSVGEVLVITENVGSASPIPVPMSARAEVDSKMVPIQAGEQSFTIDVQVTFALQ